SHRLTSGLALLLVTGLLVWAFRAYKRAHPVRRWAVAAEVFILAEALIGRGLVVLEYVAGNKSGGRALWMSGHLINTFLLLAALALTVWAAIDNARWRTRGQGALNWVLAAAIISTLILGVSGAVTALGATLFPVTSLAEGLRQDLSPTSHILIRLRFYHPLIAVGVSGLLILTVSLARAWRPNERVRRWSTALIALVLIQLGAGMVNLLLHAPVWLQLAHLLLSDLVWIALVLLAAAALAQPARESVIGEIQTAQADWPDALRV